ncbi:hypothetical protein Y032_0008g67 [Ancylostoma ceylanicum]|uniref:Uncharacterized protein n=1 Tax=Ancylostoma ceylanicum TaxID=53326 RepID=A0A016VLF8_9BILA|nr:hypothetical protein Y032_0008g67 [Ancylostoma ceylanicum]
MVFQYGNTCSVYESCGWHVHLTPSISRRLPLPWPGKLVHVKITFWVTLQLYSSRSIAVSVAAVVDTSDRPSPLSSTMATDRRRRRRCRRHAVVDPDRQQRRPPRLQG